MDSEEIKPDILLVDDEADFLRAVSQRLEARGFKTDSVTSGEAALEKIKGKNYNIVVLDLVMPGMGGMEVLKTIKKLYPDLPVLILTGQGTTAQAVAAMKEGAMDYMEKPADIETLIHKTLEARHKRLSSLAESAI
ncbi:MAG: response regulator [Nitrospirota bacterium]